MVATTAIVLLSAFAPASSQELFLDNKAKAAQACSYWIKDANAQDGYSYDSSASIDKHPGRCDCAAQGHVCADGHYGDGSCEGYDNCKKICDSVSGCGGWADCGDGCYFKWDHTYSQELASDNKVEAEVEAQGSCYWYDCTSLDGNGDCSPTSTNYDFKGGRCDCAEPGHVCGGSHFTGRYHDHCTSQRDCSNICKDVSGCGYFASCDDGCYFKSQ